MFYFFSGTSLCYPLFSSLLPRIQFNTISKRCNKGQEGVSFGQPCNWIWKMEQQTGLFIIRIHRWLRCYGPGQKNTIKYDKQNHATGALFFLNWEVIVNTDFYGTTLMKIFMIERFYISHVISWFFPDELDP